MNKTRVDQDRQTVAQFLTTWLDEVVRVNFNGPF